ncbi:MAG: hypothetical protein KC731_19385 [Myxococcales bacterium]|nr:hypothetical protein [Myxococcales bacterium]
MTDQFSYVHEALALLSPEHGLDEPTATRLLRHQLKVPDWRAGLANELSMMRGNDATDWIAVVDNDAFCMGEFEDAKEAREFVERLLAAFL